MVNIGDVGGQVSATAGSPARRLAELDYKSPWALLSAGADHSFGQTAYRATAQGALSFVDGGLFASNTINDSFAVVDTNGARGIHVLDENRPVGTTDASGRLLVPDLRSYDVNRIGIDPRDVPPDADVGQTTRLVRPQDRSGVVVRFRVRPSHGALLRLVIPGGGPIPLGSAATLLATGTTVPVGYDGEAFVQNLGARNRLSVVEPNGRTCTVAFAYRPQPRVLPTIGPLPCRAQATR